jgi:predicted RNA-binding protein with PUA-like domain
MNHWLMKSEPHAYSFEQLEREPTGAGAWNGVRNYLARNHMMAMKVGDRVLFYHSSTQPPHVVGVAEVVREAYPDHTAWDPESTGYDPKSTPENPRWMMVDVRAVQRLPTIVPLDALKAEPRLAGMLVTQRGQRLSVQPVSAEHFAIVLELAHNEPRPQNT